MPRGKSEKISEELLPDTLSLASLLVELASFPGTAITLEEAGDRILEKVMPLFPCEGCWLFGANRLDGKLELRAWRSIRPSPDLDLRWLAPVDSDSQAGIQTMDRDGAPVGFRWPALDAARMLVVPMNIQDNYVGGLVLFLDSDQQLTPSRELLIMSLASQAGLVIRSIELILASQELVLQEERSRLARQIHDGVSQNLALLLLKMEIISRLADSDPTRMKQELKKVMGILESSVYELRRSIYALRSPGLAGLGLLPALRRLARDFTEQTNIEVELSLSTVLGLTPEIQAAVFSVIQERLDIIGRGGSAHRVVMELGTSEEQLLVRVSDDGAADGVGAPLPDMDFQGEKRIGDRVKSRGGQVQVSIEPPFTAVEIRLPIR